MNEYFKGARERSPYKKDNVGTGPGRALLEFLNLVACSLQTSVMPRAMEVIPRVFTLVWRLRATLLSRYGLFVVTLLILFSSIQITRDDRC